MPAKRTTILRWTGRGSLSRLEDSVGYVLKEDRMRGAVSSIGGSILVKGPEPLGVAARLQHMPGVSWLAAGYGARSTEELVREGESLAKKYLKPGDRFSVAAEATGGVLASDLAGAITAKALEAAKGARVSESPKVRFRVAVDGKEGAVGVEVAAGVGGVPTGSEAAVCLVSGGAHSSVTAWLAMLAGFRVRLVHAMESDESLLAVARLYSELSNRGDPRGLSLVVLEGGSVPRMLAEYSAASEGKVFGGFHAVEEGPAGRLRRTASSPLYLAPEEWLAALFESLGVRPHDHRVRWGAGGSPKLTTRRFSGGPADVSSVLEGLA